MDDLFKKHYYEEDSILSKNEIWNKIKKDQDFLLNTNGLILING
jgi:hypothetical protein